MNKALAVALLAVSGCTSVRPSFMPDGTEGFSVSCRGAGSGGRCMSVPGKMCGSEGYVVFNTDREDSVGGAFNQTGGFVGTSHRSYLIFRCGHR